VKRKPAGVWTPVLRRRPSDMKVKALLPEGAGRSRAKRSSREGEKKVRRRGTTVPALGASTVDDRRINTSIVSRPSSKGGAVRGAGGGGKRERDVCSF